MMSPELKGKLIEAAVAVGAIALGCLILYLLIGR
jgi:hypothetical protein